jgi:hypothetical protein
MTTLLTGQPAAAGEPTEALSAKALGILAAAASLLLDKAAKIALRGGLFLREAAIMGAKRIEVTGSRDYEVDLLKSFGFFGEIIQWRLRLFAPTDPRLGVGALSRLFSKHPPLSAGAGEGDAQ